jgi:2-dehydropantoate 2-reductase
VFTNISFYNRQLDKERGSPMEIEVILGTPLKRAEAKGLKVPHLSLIYSICNATNAFNIEQSKKPGRL